MSHDTSVDGLLAQLRAAVNADHRRRRRRRVVAVASLAVLAMTSVAVAAVTQAPWWEGGAPAVHPRVVDRQLLGSDLPANADRSRARTVAEHDGAALVAVPLGTTGICLIPSLPGSPDIGFGCDLPDDPPAPGEDDVFRTYARPASQGEPRWIVYGRVTETGAAAIDLSEAVGAPFTIPLERGGFFVADLPEERWAALSNGAGEGRVVDASGAALVEGCTNWGPSPADEGAGRSGPTFFLREAPRPCEPRLFEPPTLDFRHAEKLGELTLTADYSIWKAGETIGFWRAASRDGAACVVPGPASGLTAMWQYPAGGRCTRPSQPWPPGKLPFQTGFGAGRIHVNHVPLYAWAVNGLVDPDAGIARIELRSAAGTAPVVLLDGFFFAQLPGTSDDADRLPDEGPYSLVAFASDGREVARQSLDAFHKRFEIGASR